MTYNLNPAKIHSEQVLKNNTRLLMLGTFYEYFDLMLYVHMAVVLNSVFFSPEDANNPFMVAFSFCSTFLAKPVGGWIIGCFGDKYGRKSVVLFCTIIMAGCCITLATLPSYQEIGDWALYIVTICRFLQGLSSIGEATASELYVFEATKLPQRYYNTALISYAGVLGMSFSLCVAKIVLSLDLNWRIVFWIGAAIILISYQIKVSLLENDCFLDAKRKLLKYTNIDIDTIKGQKRLNQKFSINFDHSVNYKVIIAYFCTYCGWPVCFYFSYIYCAGILKDLGLTTQEIISQNFYLSIINCIILYLWIHLTKYYHPLKIIFLKLCIYIPYVLFIPYLLSNASSKNDIFFIQAMTIVFGSSTIIGRGVFLEYFPILKRFRFSASLNGLSHVLIYMCASYGMVYYVKLMGYGGLLVIMIPSTLIFLYGIFRYIKFEKKSGQYYYDFSKKES